MLLLIGGSMNACSKNISWKEEVLLHDGGRIIVTRTVERGGRHEIGQTPPIKKQSLSFTMPRTGQTIVWKDKYDESVPTANFLPMQLEILNNTAYLTAYPMGCFSYNKWGRPNQPYVVFRYQDKEWQRITLQELPAAFTKLNLVFSSPDDATKKIGSNLISAVDIRKLNGTAMQPEFQTILREPLSQEKIINMCEERVLYKGAWIRPDDPIARKMIDQRELRKEQK